MRGVDGVVVVGVDFAAGDLRVEGWLLGCYSDSDSGIAVVVAAAVV